MTLDKKQLGQRGEELACRLLVKNGYRLLCRNFHSRFGELDIVAIDGDALVGVEVKTRWSSRFGTPEEAVTPLKIGRMIKTLQYYVLLHEPSVKLHRLDMVAVQMDVIGMPQAVRLVKNISQ